MEYGYVGPAFVENQNGEYVRVEIVDWFKTVYGAPVALTANDAAHHLASLHDYSEYLNCMAIIADSETIEDSRANVVAPIKSLQSMLKVMQSTLALIDG